MKSLVNVVGRRIVEFLLFVFFWSLGYLFGIIMVLLGLRDELDDVLNGGGEQDDIDKMIENMNEMGPNN